MRYFTPAKVLGLVLAVLGTACGQEAPPAAKPEAPPAAAPAAPAPPPAAAAPGVPADFAKQKAAEIFSTRCFTCHGEKGAGDGPGSAGLTPPPRNFQDPAWQASVTDEHLSKIIQYGGFAVGKSPAMPGNPDLVSQPEVVQALIALIRGLKAG
jgi:mono/diheme cytochrome c family protein